MLTAEECRAGRDEAVWEVETEELEVFGFVAVPNPPPDNPNSTHHVLEPSRNVTLDQYQASLIATRDLWDRVS